MDLREVLPYFGAAVSVYAAIRADLSLMLKRLDKVEHRLTTLEGKHHGNEAQA